MSSVVRGVGASHSTLMNTHGATPAHQDRADRFMRGVEEAARILASDQPDLAVIVGPNHFRGMWLDLMPAFTIGVGAVTGSGEAGTPGGTIRTDPSAAQHICEQIVADAFDPAFSTTLQVDHGITQAMQLLLGASELPVVPILVNVFAPPLPSLARCLDFGLALGRSIARLPGARRVAVIASGGLSHRLPWPDWRRPETDNDHFMVDAWSLGRTRWTEFEARRREIVLGAASHIDSVFDEEMLELFAEGRFAELRGLDASVIERGGNGASELRSWLIMAAAAGHRGGRRLAYEAIPEWLTGMGVALTTEAPVPGSRGAP